MERDPVSQGRGHTVAHNYTDKGKKAKAQNRIGKESC